MKVPSAVNDRRDIITPDYGPKDRPNYEKNLGKVAENVLEISKIKKQKQMRHCIFIQLFRQAVLCINCE